MNKPITRFGQQAHVPVQSYLHTTVAPLRFEAEVFDCEVVGEVPKELNGSFYRCGGDTLYPTLENDNLNNGDGVMAAFHFDGGYVDFIQRYVKTERFLLERKNRRRLYGLYRNAYTDDAATAGTDRDNTGNTTAWVHHGKLFALREDSIPYELDPVTLETKGLAAFRDQLRTKTMTAHPKLDPVTGNLLAFSYEAKGDGTPDMAYFEISPQGKLLHQIWFQAPYAAMVHDFAVTEHYVVFPLIPLTVDVERMKQGGQHFQWQPELPQLFAVVPRHGDAREVRWFKGPKDGFQGHTLNAFDEDGKVYVDMPVTGGNVFYFFPQADGFVPPPETLAASLMRWVFDLSSAQDELQPQALTDYPCEFPRCDDRYIGRKYEHGFLLAFDPQRPYNSANGPMPFQFFNLLAHINLTTGVTDAWFPGDSGCFQEPIFIPRSAAAAEGDGYVVCLLNLIVEGRSELVVLDSTDMAAGPIARIKVPFRMRMSLHGCWAPR